MRRWLAAKEGSRVGVIARRKLVVEMIMLIAMWSCDGD